MPKHVYPASPIAVLSRCSVRGRDFFRVIDELGLFLLHIIKAIASCAYPGLKDVQIAGESMAVRPDSLLSSAR